MRIAVVRKQYTPFGGGERYLQRLIAGLAGEGHEIHIFARRWAASPPENTFFHPVAAVRSPAFLEALSFAWSCAARLRRGRFDIIHAFDRIFEADIYRAGDGCHREWLAQRRRIDSPLEALLHRVNPRHRSLLYLERRLFQSPRLRLIVANSVRGREEIIRHYSVPPGKIRVIPNGVDLLRFHPATPARREEARRELGLSPAERVLLFIGSGFRRKGLPLLLRSLARMGRRDIRLLVIGRDHPAPFLRLCRELGVGERVLFAGAQADVEKFYAAGDLFVLPSIYEPFSNACAEALACGVPVLTTAQNGASELLRAGANGYVIEDPVDIPRMAELLAKALETWSKEGAREEVRRASPLISLESNVREMIRIYEEFSGRRV